jgi:excinuclease UvrABC nuclease subunit
MDDLVKNMRKYMKEAAERLDFETAIRLREQIKNIQGK